MVNPYVAVDLAHKVTNSNLMVGMRRSKSDGRFSRKDMAPRNPIVNTQVRNSSESKIGRVIRANLDNDNQRLDYNLVKKQSHRSFIVKSSFKAPHETPRPESEGKFTPVVTERKKMVKVETQSQLF